MQKSILKILKIIITALLLWFVIHSIYIITDGFSDQGKRGDLAVILGNKVNEDGTLSTRLEKRLETGIALYQQHRVQKILVSGGLGKEGFYEGVVREFLTL